MSAVFRGGRGARRANLIFVGVLLAAALALFAWGRLRAGGTVAVLRYGTDPQQELRLPLNTDQIYDVNTGEYTVHIRVQNGAAAFVDSPCPDHVCESFGALSRVGQWAACMPARATLTIETG